LARIRQTSNELVEMRSPLPGTIDSVIASNGSKVSRGDAVMTMRSDEQSVWEALRALAVVGKVEDLSLIDRYSSGAVPVSERLQQQATMTANAIKSRAH
jgi:acetyl/propionyl-CoA carboxylase alpha subunit